MKKQWKSRIISGVLTAALTITMLPAAAFGASDKETGAAKEAAAEATGNILPDGKKTDSLTEDSVWPKVDLSDNLAEDPGEDVLLEEELADKKERAAQAAAISERSGPNVTVPLPPAAETVSKPAGEGTEDAPYLITDPKELRWFAALVNGVLEGVEQNTAACARLENDISFAEDMEADISWTPISCRLEEPYTGIFDGASHVIDSLYVVTEDVEYVSLFGVNDGMIKDLTVTGAVIRCAPKWKYRGCAGVIAGRNDENGEIKNCRIESANVEGFAYVGTVAGHSYGQIHDVAVESSEVTGTRYVGGIVGEDYDGRLTGCRMGKEPSEEDQQSGTNAEAENRAAVSGVSYVGGIAGDAYASREISDCVNYENVAAVPNPDGGRNKYIGGIIGFGASSPVTGCENYGAVDGYAASSEEGQPPQDGSQGSKYIGGIAGEIYRAVLENCTNYGPVTGDVCVGGIAGYAESRFYENEGETRIHECVLKSCANEPDAAEGDCVTGKQNVGGIAGLTDGQYTSIEDCVNKSAVFGMGGDSTGGIAGWNEGHILNCTNGDKRGFLYGDFFCVGGSQVVGGIAGANVYHGVIENCNNYMSVVADSAQYGATDPEEDYAGDGCFAGGIAGVNSADIVGCSADALSESVRAQYGAGGIAGISTGTVKGCHAFIEVCGGEAVGGIAGINCTAPAEHGLEDLEEPDMSYRPETWPALITDSDFEFRILPILPEDDEDGNVIVVIAYRNFGGIAGVNEGTIDLCGVIDGRVRMDDMSVDNVGGIAGTNKGQITGAQADIQISAGASSPVGGVAGLNTGTISQAELSVSMTAYSCAGGIAGCNWISGVIDQCQIKNGKLALADDPDDVWDGEYLGGIAGVNLGSVANCDNAGGSVSALQYVGGIAGVNQGSIRECTSSADVYAEYGAGGIAGENTCYDEMEYEFPDAGDPPEDAVYPCEITGCVNTGAVSLQSGMESNLGLFGGITGYNTGLIGECINTGTVGGGSKEISLAGGIAGANDWESKEQLGVISACENHGEVSGHERVGGISGRITGGTIENSFNDGAVFGMEIVGGVTGRIAEDLVTIAVTSCYNQGRIESTRGPAGGIAGSASTEWDRSGSLQVANCYNSGKVSVNRYLAAAGVAGGAGGILGSLTYEKDPDAVSVTNCYYLNGCVDGSGIYGTEDAESGVYGMDQADFADGHVTWLLQNGVDDDVLVWGQKLPRFYDTYDEFPVFAQVAEEKVVSVIWIADDEVVHEEFDNPGQLLDITVNKDFEKEGYFLDGWYTDPEYTTAWDFAEDTTEIEDLHLYARWILDEEPVYGDADNNGTVDSADALMVLQYSVGLVQPDAPQFSYGAADVDGDLDITSGDALLILQKAVSLIERFPVEIKGEPDPGAVG